MLPGRGGAGSDKVGWGALEADVTTLVAGAGTEVDDPVRVRHDHLVVLDDDDGLAGVHQPVEQGEQVLHVGEVRTSGWLVEDVDLTLVAQVRRELEPLSLACGQGSERLTDGAAAHSATMRALGSVVRRTTTDAGSSASRLDKRPTKSISMPRRLSPSLGGYDRIRRPTTARNSPSSCCIGRE